MNPTRQQVVDRELDTVWRLCVMRLSGFERSSVEDVTQEVFLRWLDSGVEFESETHERAWFIRTTLNICTDVFRDASRHARLPLEECEYLVGSSDADDSLAEREIIREMLALPESMRDVVYLYFVLGYDTNEIAKILKRLPNTVRRQLARGREQLRDILNIERGN